MNTLIKERGFSLVELAIVLVIVAILFGTMMTTMNVQIDQRNQSETRQALADAREALIGYAMSHNGSSNGKPYLPCPATDNNTGLEARTGTSCTAVEGLLPWGTLGIGQRDAWSNRIRYRVDANYSNSLNGFTLASAAPVLQVCETITAGACTRTLAAQTPAVLVSHGPNSRGATRMEDGGQVAMPDGVDETENANGDNTFISHTPVDSGTNTFDDTVTWVSLPILLNRMVTAGKLP